MPFWRKEGNLDGKDMALFRKSHWHRTPDRARENLREGVLGLLSKKKRGRKDWSEGAGRERKGQKRLP